MAFSMGGMGGGMGFGLIGTAVQGVMGIMSAKEKAKVAKQQMEKAKKLQLEANQVQTKSVLDDPAYKMKEFLANSGLPGYDTRTQEIEGNTATAGAQGMKTASSGGQALSYLAALQVGQDKQLRDLGVQDATFRATQKGNLASTRKTWQDEFDALARLEKEKLNYAASQYENAGTLNKLAAKEQIYSTIGQTVSNMFGSSQGGGSSSGGMGGGMSSPNLKSIGAIGLQPSQLTDVGGNAANVQLSQGEIGELAQKLVNNGSATDLNDAMLQLQGMGFIF